MESKGSTLQITLDVPGALVKVSAEDWPEIITQYEKMGGDGSWLINQTRAAVAAHEHGEATGVAISALGGRVASASPKDTAPASRASRDAVSDASDTMISGSDWPSDDEPVDEFADTGPADPWDDTPEPSQPARGRTGQRRAAPERPPVNRRDPADDVNTEKDKFGRAWTSGLPEAPDCECGEPAARMKAKSKAGKPYTVWKCAKGAPGGDWQDKCEFSEFPN